MFTNMDLFLSMSAKIVKELREAGLNDTRIGWILYEIRANALNADKVRRDEFLKGDRPDYGQTGFDIAELIKNF